MSTIQKIKILNEDFYCCSDIVPQVLGIKYKYNKISEMRTKEKYMCNKMIKM